VCRSPPGFELSDRRVTWLLETVFGFTAMEIDTAVRGGAAFRAVFVVANNEFHRGYRAPAARTMV